MHLLHTFEITIKSYSIWIWISNSE